MDIRSIIFKGDQDQDQITGLLAMVFVLPGQIFKIEVAGCRISAWRCRRTRCAYRRASRAIDTSSNYILMMFQGGVLV
jgi:hypothetical protein